MITQRQWMNANVSVANIAGVDCFSVLLLLLKFLLWDHQLVNVLKTSRPRDHLRHSISMASLSYARCNSSNSMHHYECLAPCKDNTLQRGRFCARSLASYIPRSSKDRQTRWTRKTVPISSFAAQLLRDQINSSNVLINTFPFQKDQRSM